MEKVWWDKRKFKEVDPFSQRAKFQKFYASMRWQRLRSYILSSGICCRCERMGKTTAGTEVNHIISLDEDYSKRLDPENLELLCKSCHSIVTAGEQKEKKKREIRTNMNKLNNFN
jgi:5-methylcytosine-specific restriction enzyme A